MMVNMGYTIKENRENKKYRANIPPIKKEIPPPPKIKSVVNKNKKAKILYICNIDYELLAKMIEERFKKKYDT